MGDQCMSFQDNFKSYKFPKLGLVRLPQVKIDKEIKESLGLKRDCLNLEVLRALTEKGFVEKQSKFNQARLKEYRNQIEFELNIVEELGFTDYFLLVWLVINKARDLGAFIDYGRGSCAGSLIIYLLGITGVDPIEKQLFFQRFISKTRAKKEIIDEITYIYGDLSPDIDLNLGGVRNEIIKWLELEYAGKISQITAISTLTGKILIKDIYKSIKEVSEEEAKRVSDMIEKVFGIVEDIEKMPEKSKSFKKWAEENKDVFNTCLKLRGLIRQKSVHASGYLLSFYDLDGFIPVELNKDNKLTCSYEMDDTAQVAIKLDLLGLTTNEIIKDILSNIPEKIEDIELDSNPIVYDQFQNDNLLPYGLYQISADCALRVLNQIKPKNINELSDVNAISRPGSLSFLKDYVNNSVNLPHELFKNTLKVTRNQCLYQEQVLQLLAIVGFTLDEAEQARRICGKKLVKEVGEWKQKIFNRVKDKGFPESVGVYLWELMEANSKYGFNKCIDENAIVEVKSLNFQKVIKNQFELTWLDDPNFCYVLGFLWGDGHLRKVKNKYWQFIFEIDKSDFKEVKPIFDNYFKYSYYLTNRNLKIVSVSFLSATLGEFLSNLDFLNKGTVAPLQILNALSHKNAFLLGLFDADGCAYYDPKWHASRLSLTASYSMDYTFFKESFPDILFSIKRTVGPKGNNSVLTCSNKAGITKIFNSFYQKSGAELYLTRKYQKFCKILKLEPKVEKSISVKHSRSGNYILAYDEKLKENVLEKIKNVYFNTKMAYELCCSEFSIKCSEDHKILTDDGMKTIKDLLNKPLVVKTKNGYYNPIISKTSELIKTIDLEIDSEFHNFYANGIVVSNSHSTATSYTSALSVYLKYKYPLQFYTACLRGAKNLSNPIDEIALIESELKYFNIKLLPPHILKSEIDFSIEGNNIRFGLGQIKGIAEKNIIKLAQFKHEFSNKFEIFQGANEAKIPISILHSLISVGALDSNIKESRAFVALEAQTWNLLTDKEKDAALKFGSKFDFNLVKTLKHIKENEKNEKGKPIIKDSRYETIKRDYAPYHEIYKENKKYENFAQYYFENQLLGFGYSFKLKDLFGGEIQDLVNVGTIKDMDDKTYVHVVGQVMEDIKEGVSKEKKTNYLRFTIKDDSGKMTCMLFNDRILDHEDQNGRKVKENDIVVVRGRKMNDAIFADVVGIQDIKIFSRLSQLKKSEETIDLQKELNLTNP